jgi:hypothetical protein
MDILAWRFFHHYYDPPSLGGATGEGGACDVALDALSTAVDGWQIDSFDVGPIFQDRTDWIF